MSVREDEDGYIHFTAHPDKLALECYNKEGSNSYCTSCSESDGSSGEEVGSSPQRHSRRISKVETVEKLPHRYFEDSLYQLLIIYLHSYSYYIKSWETNINIQRKGREKGQNIGN